jgi:hypothetical protein
VRKEIIFSPLPYVFYFSKKQNKTKKTLLKEQLRSQEWQCIPAIPAPGRLRQEDLKFKANPVLIVKPCLKQTNKQNQK